MRAGATRWRPSRRPCGCCIRPCRSSPKSFGSAWRRARRGAADLDRAGGLSAVPQGGHGFRGGARNRAAAGDRDHGAHLAHRKQAGPQAAARRRALLAQLGAGSGARARGGHSKTGQREAGIQGRSGAQGRGHALHRAVRPGAEGAPGAGGGAAQAPRKRARATRYATSPTPSAS